MNRTEVHTQKVEPFSLKSFSLRGKSNHMRQQMTDDVFVLGRMALLGQVTHFYAAPNTGKTLITMWLIAAGIESGAIDPEKIFYINADDSFKGLTEKTELAEHLGFEMLAPGHEGFDARQFSSYIRALIDQDVARGGVIILDTVKKFTSLMHKTEGANFGTLLREYSLKGGTVIGLSHVNKHRNPDGELVYSGTSDLPDDADCIYIVDMDSSDDQFRVVTFTNKKNRGDVTLEASYKYHYQTSVPWIEKYSSIKPLGEDEIARVKAQQASDEMLLKNRDTIDAIIKALSNGPLNQGALVKAVSSASAISRRATIRVLEASCGSNNHCGQFWFVQKADKNSTVFTLNHGAETFWKAKKLRLPGGM